MNQETESASADKLPPLEYLRECFSYDPESGRLTWKERPLHHFVDRRAQTKFNNERAGKFASTEFAGRIFLSMRYMGRKRRFQAVHIIFRLMEVEIPTGYEVDHINRISSDDRWCNLRLATKSQNAFNRLHKRRSTLPKWVYEYSPGRFTAQVFAFGKKHILGVFSTPEEAHLVASEKARVLHGEFFRAS